MLTKLLCESRATALTIIFGVGVHCDTVLKAQVSGLRPHVCHHHLVFWHLGLPVCLWRRRVHEPRYGACPVHRRPGAVEQLHPFMIADMLGGFAGAVIAWLMYADEFKASDGVVDPVAQRNIFSTNPTTEGTNYARTSSARLSAPLCSSAPSLLPLTAPARTF